MFSTMKKKVGIDSMDYRIRHLNRIKTTKFNEVSKSEQISMKLYDNVPCYKRKVAFNVIKKKQKKKNESGKRTILLLKICK